jgi:hypothetical protein
MRRLVLVRRVIDGDRRAIDASVALSDSDRKNHEQAGKQHGCSDENVSRHFCSSLAPILRFPCSRRSCPNCLRRRESVAQTDLSDRPTGADIKNIECAERAIQGIGER